MSTETRAELVQQLRKLGVEMVTAEYNGEGDSGQVEDPEFGSSKVPRNIAFAVQDLFYAVLEDEYGGWEINEGSFGQFEWNVTDDQIHLSHSTRSWDTEECDL